MNQKNKRLSAAELARLSGYSKSSITNFVRDGLLEKGDDGKFDCVHSLEQIQRHEAARQQDGKRPENTELAALRREYMKGRIALLQIEINKARGEVHRKDECCASLGELLSTVNFELHALPSQFQSAYPEVPGLSETGISLINAMVERIHDFCQVNGAKITEPLTDEPKETTP